MEEHRKLSVYFDNSNSLISNTIILYRLILSFPLLLLNSVWLNWQVNIRSEMIIESKKGWMSECGKVRQVAREDRRSAFSSDCLWAVLVSDEPCSTPSNRTPLRLSPPNLSVSPLSTWALALTSRTFSFHKLYPFFYRSTSFLRFYGTKYRIPLYNSSMNLSSLTQSCTEYLQTFANLFITL